VQTSDGLVIVAQPLQLVGRDLLPGEALVLSSQIRQSPVLPTEIIGLGTQPRCGLALDEHDNAQNAKSGG
jgi:hypothetical protein